MTFYSREYWNLAQSFAYYGFKMRDQSTILGFFWTLLHPILLFSLLYLLFKQRLGAEIENFGVYLLIGIVHWNMFATSTTKAVQSLVSRRDMVVAMSFPRELIVLGDVGAILLSSALEFVVLMALAVIVGAPLSLAWILLPGIFILQAVLTLAVSLILSAANVFVRDVERVWTLVTRVGFFSVPIFYPLSILTDPLAYAIVSYNPLTQYMEATRRIVLGTSELPPVGIVYAALLSMLLLSLGIRFLRRAEIAFAERL